MHSSSRSTQYVAPKAANDNLSKARRDRRRAWLKEERSIRGGAFDALNLAIGMATFDGYFHVNSPAWQDKLRTSRKTVFNRLRQLQRMGLIVKTGGRRWVYPYFRLTLPVDHLHVAKANDNEAAGCKELTHQLGNNCPTFTLNHSDISISEDSTEVWICELGADRSARSRQAPMPLQADEGAHLPAHLVAEFNAEFGPRYTRSYLFVCDWVDGCLVTTSPGRAKWFAHEGRAFCEANDVSVRLDKAAS